MLAGSASRPGSDAHVGLPVDLFRRTKNPACRACDRRPWRSRTMGGQWKLPDEVHALRAASDHDRLLLRRDEARGVLGDGASCEAVDDLWSICTSLARCRACVASGQTPFRCDVDGRRLRSAPRVDRRSPRPYCGPVDVVVLLFSRRCDGRALRDHGPARRTAERRSSRRQGLVSPDPPSMVLLPRAS